MISPKIICLTYTCERDTERAAFHAKYLPPEWRKVWCVESKDEKIPAPEGVEILVRDFPRGGTLKKRAAIEGMRKIFLELSADCDLLIKLDSDTALFEPYAFSAPFVFAGVDFTYLRRLSIESRLLANGCVYAVSKRALRKLAENFRYEEFPACFDGHEDLIFSSFWTVKNKDLTLCQIDKLRWSWSKRPYVAADCYGAHNGYLTKKRDFELCEKIAALKNRGKE